MIAETPRAAAELNTRFGADVALRQETRDALPTFWVAQDRISEVLRHLKTRAELPYPMLYDLFVVDERLREHRARQPASDFTICYHLLSPGHDEDLRLKVALRGERPTIPSVVDLWPAANWYEREAWDMFGITFAGHPNLRRLLLPPGWQGHPLRFLMIRRPPRWSRTGFRKRRRNWRNWRCSFIPRSGACASEVRIPTCSF